MMHVTLKHNCNYDEESNEEEGNYHCRGKYYKHQCNVDTNISNYPWFLEESGVKWKFILNHNEYQIY